MNLRARAVLAGAASRLEAAGVASPVSDARILLGHVTGLDAIALLSAPGLDEKTARRYDHLIDQRCAGVPLQHLTGRSWFRNVSVQVGRGVFIPRPETELVAGAAIDEARRGSSALVVELCAGSGAISAALAEEVPGARVFAVELDRDAARWLRRNLIGTSVEAIEQDMAEALHELDGQVDVVVANPPYIPWDARDDLPVEVRGHDPAVALFADDNGLAAIRGVIAVAQAQCGKGLAPSDPWN